MGYVHGNERESYFIGRLSWTVARMSITVLSLVCVDHVIICVEGEKQPEKYVTNIAKVCVCDTEETCRISNLAIICCANHCKNRTKTRFNYA